MFYLFVSRLVFNALISIRKITFIRWSNLFVREKFHPNLFLRNMQDIPTVSGGPVYRIKFLVGLFCPSQLARSNRKGGNVTLLDQPTNVVFAAHLKNSITN